LAATSAVVGLGLAATIILYFLNLETMFLTFETIMSQLSGAKRFVAKQAIKKRIVNGITTSII
jgi:hypothetical protein